MRCRPCREAIEQSDNLFETCSVGSIEKDCIIDENAIFEFPPLIPVDGRYPNFIFFYVFFNNFIHFA